MRSFPSIVAAVLAACTGVATTPVHAASIYFTEAAPIGPLPSFYEVQMWMNFSAAEATLGGSIDIDLLGSLTFVSFTPSAWLTSSAVDPAFTGHGTTYADHEYEVHFGNFAGVSGNNLLGTLRLNVAAPGSIVLAPTQQLGGFYSLSGALQNVQLVGTTIPVPVPEPASAALWLAGAGVLAWRLRRGYQA